MSERTTSPSFPGFLRRRRGRGHRSGREAAVTTEGDEVVVTLGLVMFQTTRHGVIVTSNILGLHPCAMKPRMEDSGVPGAAVWRNYTIAIARLPSERDSRSAGLGRGNKRGGRIGEMFHCPGVGVSQRHRRIQTISHRPKIQENSSATPFSGTAVSIAGSRLAFNLLNECIGDKAPN
jgi:hypothetical protein